MNSIDSAGLFSRKWLVYIFLIISPWLGMLFSVPSPRISILYPPAGLALGILILYGLSHWKFVFISLFTGIISVIAWFSAVGEPFRLLSASFMNAAGITLEAFVGAWLIRKFADKDNPLGSVKSSFIFLIFGGPVSCTIGGLSGILIMKFLYGQELFSELNIFWTWTMGNATGVVIFASVFFIPYGKRINDLRYSFRTLTYAAIVVLFYILLFLFKYFDYSLLIDNSIIYLTLPLLVWIAFHFLHQGVIIALSTISVILTYQTINGDGLFIANSVAESIALLQMYVLILGFTGFIVAASRNEHEISETALRISKEELFAIFNNSPVIMILLDRDRKIRRLNNTAKIAGNWDASNQHSGAPGDLFGCIGTEKDHCGMGERCKRCVLRETITGSFLNSKEYRQIDWRVERRINGSVKVFWYLVSTSLISFMDEELVLVSLEDITDLKKAEAEVLSRDRILESAARLSNFLMKTEKWEDEFESYLENLKIASDSTATFLYQNIESDNGSIIMKRRFIWDEEPERIQKRGHEIEYSYTEYGLDRWYETMVTGETIHGNIDELGGPEKEFISTREIASFTLVPIFSQGEFWGFIGFSDRRKARQWTIYELDALKIVADSVAAALDRQASRIALKRQQAYYSDVFQSIQDGMLVLDKNLNIMSINDTLKSWFPGKGDPIGKKCHDYFYDRDSMCENCLSISSINDGETQRRIVNRTINSKDSTFELHNFPLKDHISGQIIGVIEYVRDITFQVEKEKENRELELQLIQSQKMEAIGRLAGGIAHDFNNTLTSIMGYAELLDVKFQDMSPLEKKAISIIIEGCERASGLTKQLLGFARGGKYNPVPLNVNDIIKDTLKITGVGFGRKIEISMQLEENPYPVNADRVQMQQVFTNLIINARDAMEETGKLVLKTENVVLDNDIIDQYSGPQSGKHLRCVVTDTGSGISLEIQRKIFEPFFTTKKTGEGTGLGLATVFGIVKNHNGFIDLYSKPGSGSSFILHLPAEENSEIIEESVEEDELEKGSGETILLVDDEVNVRSVLKYQLIDLGYDVIEAQNGMEAIEKYDSSIDIVLLDLIMPVLDGTETLKELIGRDKDVKVLIMSGFSKSKSARETMNAGAKGFIQKPVKFVDLSRKIKSVLN